MGLDYRAVLDAALRLSDEDRGMIAERLLETLSPDCAELNEDELATELDRRLQEAKNDPSQSVSWNELRDEQ
jgi:putative addiction module component (TIGR02574 family)